MCALRKRIFLAIGIVQESSRAIGAMPALILFPVIQCVGLFAFVAVWIVYAVHQISLGKLETYELVINGATITGREFVHDQSTEYQGWFLLFCFFWTTQFIVALGQIIIALAVASWFFKRDKSLIGNATVFKAIWKTLLFHAGTAAFGSLILAIVSTIRSFLTYVQKKAAKTGNKVILSIMMCLQCCVWCVEKCLKFLNKNAYIQTAIFGSSFCTSARAAFFLILRNVARVGTLSAISEIVVLVGKLFIAVITGGCSYFIIDHILGDEISSPVCRIGPKSLLKISRSRTIPLSRMSTGNIASS